MLDVYKTKGCEMAMAEILITAALAIISFALYSYLRNLIYVKPKRKP
jgi:uncharacterized protein with PQ loop repeat